MEDISTAEYRKAIRALKARVGLKCDAYTYIETEGLAYSVSLYPNGIGGRNDGYLNKRSDTLAGALKDIGDAWTEYEAKHKTATIRKMALAVIRITAELGECTDAALRNCGEFDHNHIKAYGEQACADANDIAGRGPFSIIVKGGANAEAA